MQISLYLDEVEAQKLRELAKHECRRPHEQVRYLLRNVLLSTNDNSDTKSAKIERVAVVSSQPSAVA